MLKNEYEAIVKARGTKTINSLLVQLKDGVNVNDVTVGRNIHNYNKDLKVFPNETYVMFPSMLYKDDKMYQDCEQGFPGEYDLTFVDYTDFDSVVVSDGVAKATYGLFGDGIDSMALYLSDVKNNVADNHTDIDGKVCSEDIPFDINVNRDMLNKYFNIVGVE